MNASRTMALSKPARTFQDLLVWQKAHQFVLAVYAITTIFPKQETYGLSQQMRRAAVSIPANIAEGFRRRGKADKARFMNMAEGSIEECRYYLILAQDLATPIPTGSLLRWRKSAGSSARTPPPFCLLAPDSLDSRIPQGYQGRSPWLVRTYSRAKSLRTLTELGGFSAGLQTDYRRRLP